jgi:hypothetical protein
MIIKFLIFTFFILNTYAFTHFFNNWHCVGINPCLDKPYKFKIGELPLVAWKKNDTILSTINICRHLGSKLNKGTIKNGNLHCPYHNLKHDESNNFGKIIMFEDKLWWSYNPIYPTPPNIPFYNKSGFKLQHVECIMNIGLNDSIYNLMNLHYQEFLHNNIFGFDSSIPPTNVRTVKSKNRVALYFDYHIKNQLFSKEKKDKISRNVNMFISPNNVFSKITFDSNILIICVSMLPINNCKTKLYVSINHNFTRNNIVEMQISKLSTKIILSKNSNQFDKMVKDFLIKKKILHYDKSIQYVKEILKDYKYPNLYLCTQFIKSI